MEVRVRGPGPAAPFLSAQDLFETEYDLSLPVEVHVESGDPRTMSTHFEDRHVLRLSGRAATSALAKEIALHEYAHMYRDEQYHPSHTQRMEEIIMLAFPGERMSRRTLSHCYQIANHMKDIYADDITLSVTPPSKLVSFLESGLAEALSSNRPVLSFGGVTATPGSDPAITAVNAAFALALCERHDLLDADHQLYDLARAAARDAPTVDLDAFTDLFRSLAPDPNESEYRRTLVDATRSFVAADQAAD